MLDPVTQTIEIYQSVWQNLAKDLLVSGPGSPMADAPVEYAIESRVKAARAGCERRAQNRIFLGIAFVFVGLDAAGRMVNAEQAARFVS